MKLFLKKIYYETINLYYVALNFLRPNSFIHTKSIDILADSKQKKFSFSLWIIQNFLIGIISKVIINIIIFIEKFSVPHNEEFFRNNIIDKNTRCFIFGTGPSLNQFNFDCVKENDITICSNSFYLTEISKKIDINFYSIINKNWFDNISNNPEKFGTNLDQTLIKLQNKFKKSTFIFHDKYFNKFKYKISENIIRKYYFNFSQLDFLSYFPKSKNKKFVFPRPVDVSHFNIMLAYYLGVKEIYLVGVDHSETTDHVSAKKRAHDYKKIEIKESAAFLSASKYENKNSIYLNEQGGSIKDLEMEKLNFNNYWWRWYRALIYYKTFNIFKNNNIHIYKVRKVGTLDFIPVKSP